MDITQLEYLKVIAETGSLTRAGERLHISQPAMSIMLKKIEEELGTELFDRGPNRIKLNAAGEAALIYINNILWNVEQMKKELRAQAMQEQTLALLFCDHGIQWYCIPRFPAAHPEIKVTSFLYQNEDEVKLLEHRTCDILISPGKIKDENVISIPFLKDRVFLSVPENSRYAELESISIRDIDEQSFLVPDFGGYLVQQLENIIRTKNPKIKMIKSDWIITQQLIQTTDMLSTSSVIAIEAGLRNDGPNRVLVPLSDPELKVTYHINYLRGSKRKAEKFRSWAKTVVEQHKQNEQ